MRKTYLVLARVISVLVVVQAITITFAVAGLFNWITEKGGVVDEATVKGWDESPPTFTGAIGHFIHVVDGEQVIPTVALLLLIVSFFAKVPKGVVLALVTFVLVIAQLLSGKYGDHLPYLGLWHGLGAFLVFGAAMAAAMAAKREDASTAPASS